MLFELPVEIPVQLLLELESNLLQVHSNYVSSWNVDETTFAFSRENILNVKYENSYRRVVVIFSSSKQVFDWFIHF